jgi:hypothetical protein
MKPNVRRIATRISLSLLVLLAAVLAGAKMAGFGCAGKPPAPGDARLSRADLLEGSWSGTWASNQSQMSGDLRCRIEKLKPGAYLAHFDAVFAKYLTNQSTVTLNVRPKAAVWHFTGQEDLGLIKGGLYKYDGRSDGNEFFCDYDSKYDKGTFRLKRLASTTAPAGT